MLDKRKTTLVDGREPYEGYTDLKDNGQQKDYLVLSAEERAKGFVRPVRLSYAHVGIPGPKYPLRDLDARQQELYGDSYDKFEEYPPGSASRGRFWTNEQLRSVGKGCGTVTRMSLPLAETYARDPYFYGGTFCCGCGRHFPVGERGEFVWKGTDERVGT